MQRSALGRGFAFAEAAPVRARAYGTGLARALLLGGCVLAASAAAWQGDPASYLRADPELARLLRGMALIKSGIALAAIAAVLWRLGWPLTRPATAAGYLGACWVLAGSCMLIWQLTDIAVAAIAFDGAGLVLLGLVWHEHRAARSMPASLAR